MHYRFGHTNLAAALALPASPHDRDGPFGRAVAAPIPEQDNHKFHPEQHPRPLRDPHAAAERLAEWSETARLAGRLERADRLLLLAWEAYDRPARISRHPEATAGLLAA